MVRDEDDVADIRAVGQYVRVAGGGKIHEVHVDQLGFRICRSSLLDIHQDTLKIVTAEEHSASTCVECGQASSGSRSRKGVYLCRVPFRVARLPTRRMVRNSRPSGASSWSPDIALSTSGHRVSPARRQACDFRRQV